MVNISLMRESNRQIDETAFPKVAVFAGGTAGIGKITLGALARHGLEFKAYVVGRRESKQAFQPYIDSLHAANPRATIIWVEGQITLLAEVKRVCDYIKTLESRIDLLFLTAGYAPFNGRQNTSEGLDISHALSFYSRLCFTLNLLPLLRLSPTARVISVLSGPLEPPSFLFDPDDLNLEKPGAFGAMRSQPHMGIMNTLAFERLADMDENKSVVFIHNHPGIVRTGNLWRGFDEGSWGMWFAAVLIDPVLWLWTYGDEVSGERYLYIVTGGGFGGKGVVVEGVTPRGRNTRGGVEGGFFLVTRKMNAVMNEGGMKGLRVRASEKVWEKMQQYLGPHV